MKKVEKIRNFRLYLLKEIETLSTHQLNFIPVGFSNNIIWNVGHLTAAMQNVCYTKAGLPMTVPSSHVNPFISGTKPSGQLDLNEINKVKHFFIESVNQLESDMERDVFNNYSPAVIIQKIYGVEVVNIDDALDYLLFHEGYHTSSILSLKKQL